jgi:hypothetical protein
MLQLHILVFKGVKQMQLDFCRLTKLTHVEMLSVATKQVIGRSNACKKCLP